MESQATAEPNRPSSPWERLCLRCVSDRSPTTPWTINLSTTLDTLARTYATTIHQFDAGGRNTKTIDPLERVTEYVYDRLNRLEEMKLPAVIVNGNGPVVPIYKYTYDAVGNRLTETDPLGRVTSTEYYPLRDLPKTVTRPRPTPHSPLPKTEYIYDPGGNVTTVVDLSFPHHQTDVSYLYTDQPWRKILPEVPTADSANSFIRPFQYFGYDAMGNVIWERDLNWVPTEYQYDRLNRLKFVIHSEPNFYSPLNPNLNPLSVITQRPVIEYEYDLAGRVTKVRDPLRRITETKYDHLGRTQVVIQPAPLSGEIDYLPPSTAGAIPIGTSPFTSYAYDPAGNLLSQTDSDGAVLRTTTFNYDRWNRRKSELLPGATNPTQYTYDWVGNRTTLTDPDNNVWSWRYDSHNRVIQERLGRENENLTPNKVRFFHYDLVGNLLATQDRNGRVIRYTYDGLNHVDTESWFANATSATPLRTLVFRYDVSGQLRASSDPDHSYSFTYDNLGRETKAVLGVTTRLLPGSSPSPATHFVEVHQWYDRQGQRVAAKIEANPGVLHNRHGSLRQVSYDLLGRTKQIVEQGYEGADITGKRVNFTYDLAHQLDTITRYKSTTVATEHLVVSSKHSFDRSGRLKELRHRGGTEDNAPLLAGYQFTYDRANQLTGQNWLHLDPYNESVIKNASQTGYSYNAQGELTRVDRGSSGTEERYLYDQNGNRITAGWGNTTATYGNGTSSSNNAPYNRLSTDGTYVYSYDDEGNMTQKTPIAANSGLPTWQYRWDHRNRLVKVLEKPTAATPDSLATNEDTDVGIGRAQQQARLAVAGHGENPLRFTIPLRRIGRNRDNARI